MAAGARTPTPILAVRGPSSQGVHDDPTPATFRPAPTILLQLRNQPKSAGRLLSSMRNGSATSRGAYWTPPPQPAPRPAEPPPQQVPRLSAAFTPPTHVPNYLVQAIVVTILCCLPFGIVSIVFAAQVNGKLGAGDYAGALDASNKAKTWAWVSFWVGLAGTVLAILIGIVGAGA